MRERERGEGMWRYLDKKWKCEWRVEVGKGKGRNKELGVSLECPGLIVD